MTRSKDRRVLLYLAKGIGTSTVCFDKKNLILTLRELVHKRLNLLYSRKSIDPAKLYGSTPLPPLRIFNNHLSLSSIIALLQGRAEEIPNL